MKRYALLSWVLIGCTPEVSVIDSEAEGDDPGECLDGADNDQDGLFDCEDPDCAPSPDCGGSGGDSGTSNTPPSAPEIQLSHSCADTDEDITCTVTTPSEDPDDDPVDYQFDWSSNLGGSSTGAQLSSATTTGGEEWTCTVTPSDGMADGPAASEALPIYGPCTGQLSTAFGGGLTQWTVLGGSVSAGDGYISLLRSRSEWAAAYWDASVGIEGGMQVSAELSVLADQGVVGVCVADGNSSTGIAIPGLSDLHGKGYCLLLSSETQNNSQRGAFLVSGDVTGNVSILAEQVFSPNMGQHYTLSLERTCFGALTFRVDGALVDTVEDSAAKSFSRVLMVGGEDDYTSSAPGGHVHRIDFEGCQ